MSAEAGAGVLKILIVDDDETFTDILARKLSRLEKYPAVCEVCHSGHDMLDHIYRQAYDLIFLDVGLPGMDGLEVLARVGQMTLPLPIIMVTGRDNARTAVEAMKRGVLDFYLKEDLLALDLALAVPRFMKIFRQRQENAELKHISQMKDDFLATISHELRTPLTSILGLCEVLLTGRMGALKDEQTHSLRKILAQSHNLVRIINQLLDIRAFTQGAAKLETQPTAFQSLVRRHWENAGPLFEKKGIKAALALPEEPLWVEAHEENLDKVVEQLLANALKFTPKDGQVRIEARKMDSGHVHFKVVDSGLGIPSASLPHVFQKFFHVDQTLTRPYGGMGLGLAFCREVIEAHGGRIWVESKGDNQGTMVSFILPGAAEPAVPAPSGLGANGHQKTILWVDDNPTLLELVEYSFAGFSYPVNLVTANGGRAALALLAKSTPDLIVLDVMMPEIDGLEMLDRLRKDPKTKGVPVLVVSGYKEAAKKALDRGADDYCLKPFRIQDVFKKIESLFLLRRAA